MQGVVTKIDKVDPGDKTLAHRLKGEGKNAWVFSLGVAAMRNRSQRDIENKLTSEDVDKAEASFFSTHPVLAPMLKSAPSADGRSASVLGAGALVNKVVELQTEAIVAAIPKLTADIARQLEDRKADLSRLPLACTSIEACQRKFTQLLFTLAGTVREVSQANYISLRNKAPGVVAGDHDGDSASLSELHMMPRLDEFCTEFEKALRIENVPIFSAEYRAEVAAELKESSGASLPDVIPTFVFAKLVQKQAESLKAPAVELVNAVHEYMGSFCAAMCSEYFGPFPSLEEHCVFALSQFLGESRKR